MSVLKNHIRNGGGDLCAGLEVSASGQHSLGFGQIVLLGSVKKSGGWGKKECLFKNRSANEGVRKNPGLCTQLPFFLKKKQLPFLFTVLAIAKCCDSVDTFPGDQLALWAVSPLPASSSQPLPSSACFHHNTVKYYF